MKKILILFCVVFLLLLVNLKVYSNDDNKLQIIINCIDENLNPCSSHDELTHSVNKSYGKIKENKLSKDKSKKEKIIKKKIVKSISTKKIKKKKEFVKNKKAEKHKKLPKKKKKNKEKNNYLMTKSNKSNHNIDSNKNMSFDDFKNLLIDYSISSKYPNIDN